MDEDQSQPIRRRLIKQSAISRVGRWRLLNDDAACSLHPSADSFRTIFQNRETCTPWIEFSARELAKCIEQAEKYSRCETDVSHRG